MQLHLRRISTHTFRGRRYPRCNSEASHQARNYVQVVGTACGCVHVDLGLYINVRDKVVGMRICLVLLGPKAGMR